jgi:hypothetical protein
VCLKTIFYALIITCGVSIGLYLFPTEFVQVVVISLAASAVLTYSTWNRISFELFVDNLKYGFTFGISIYVIGLAIVICDNFFGPLITALIVISEFAFTSAYTYIDMMEWVENQKSAIERAKKEKASIYSAQEHQDASEIANRLRP